MIPTNCKQLQEHNYQYSMTAEDGSMCCLRCLVIERDAEIKRLRSEATSLSALRDKFDVLEYEYGQLRQENERLWRKVRSL